jgi:RimJ/RimL family protein N-acetyltransferase
MNLKIRNANLGDTDTLLEWRNDPLTRSSSHNTGIISRAEHAGWLANSLSNSKRQIFIAEIEDSSAGMIRVDEMGPSKQATLSWAVAPRWRGRGIGSRMLSLICKMYNHFDLLAEIKVDNTASQRMVRKCNFTLFKTHNDITVWRREASNSESAAED